MTLDSFDQQVKELKACIKEKSKHLYIEKHISQPVIDEVKLALLINIFKHSSLAADEQKKYLISSMLVQMAADIHEKVPATNVDKTYSSEKEKQMLVLAGDYYSGLHYLYLAHTGDFEMLRTIARTIREINEFKMDLYYNHNIQFDEILNIQGKIHSLITIRILELFTDFSVHSFITDIIMVYQLIVDRESIVQLSETHLFAKIVNKQSTETILHHIDQAISDHIERLENQLSDPSTAPILQLLNFDQLFSDYIVKQCSFVEEG